MQRCPSELAIYCFILCRQHMTYASLTQLMLFISPHKIIQQFVKFNVSGVNHTLPILMARNIWTKRQDFLFGMKINFDVNYVKKFLPIRFYHIAEHSILNAIFKAMYIHRWFILSTQRTLCHVYIVAFILIQCLN